MINSARVHYFDLASQFLEFLLRKDASTTTLIVCSTRDVFFEQLAISCGNHPQQQEESVPDYESASRTSFLTNSIGLIAKSQRVKLAFCPTLEILRAYLSTVQAASTTDRPLLAILNLVAIHTGTPELSAQGLSRTFALVTEVASRENMNLALCECKDIMGGEHDREPGRWDIQVPLLTASVASGEGERTSTGRTVTVKRVAQKWFDFDKADNTADRMEI